ncbi:MAG: glycerol-3-phosphate dehydrogenase/oxidase [Burkholderiales bacterium]|nr:glycerol-3-phosphate dehydrogenase/oxidase [Burkholderiales bacterium]
MSDSVDILVIGGGITGAGIALEAARRGASVLLVEQKDFAWGTSSRSSKLVHGGLRYLREGAIGLTRESVLERRQLLHDAPGLVEPQRFLIGHYRGRSPGQALMRLGLAVYDLLGGERHRHAVDAAGYAQLAPHTRQDGLLSGSGYLDAKTDDARLVWRVLEEARSHGAQIRNYTQVDQLILEQGRVRGAHLRGEDGQTADVRARCVISATGVWADRLRQSLGQAPKLRPLRGSHLLIPLWRLPVAQSISLFHPRDGRPVFAYPWEGMALVGTTDIDHPHDLNQEPGITSDEVQYLLEAVQHTFPHLDIEVKDVVSTYAGVRPVVSSGAADPSKETRDHIVLNEQGLITVTGGKLTTFRAIALDTLKHAAKAHPELGLKWDEHPILSPNLSGPSLLKLDPVEQERLLGRFGARAESFVACADPRDCTVIAGTRIWWAELAWIARHESVRHLDDLLLRRTRLGLVLPRGAQDLLPEIKARVQSALKWDDATWQSECARYAELIARCYSLPTSLKEGRA